MASNEFREQYKVEVDDAYRIIRELNDSMKLYYPDNDKADQRTQALRSGENVYLTLMMLARILYMIDTESEGLVESEIIMRSKAENSQKKKEKRRDRKARKEKGENVDLKDILACTAIWKHVHCNENFSRIFSNATIQQLYNERNSNLQLMEITVDFIKKMVNNSVLTSEVYNRGLTRQEKDEIIGQCDHILRDISTYYAEENGKERENKEGKKKIKIDQFVVQYIYPYVLEVCILLQNQKITEKKEKLEKRIKGLKNEIKSEKDETKKGKLRSELEDLMDKKKKIGEYESQNRTNDVINVFAEMERLKSDKKEEEEELDIYTAIRKYLEDRIIWKKDNGNKLLNEQLISLLSIAILYILLKLQFKNENSKYQSDNYDKILTDLKFELKKYKKHEIDKDEKGRSIKWNNMTFTDIRILLSRVIQLHACLSDKLEYETIKDQMDLIVVFIQKTLGMDGFVKKEENKTNGYVAIHFDFFQGFEFKTTTGFGYANMTHGSAAYGNRKSSEYR